MGWNPFKSEEVTRVATQVSRVISDAALPDSIQSGSIKSIFNDGNMTDYILDDLIAGLGTRAERMYRYGEAHYEFGMPSGEVYSSTQGLSQVQAAIQAAEGRTVSMEYSHYGTLNALHVGWMKLVASYSYDPATNKIGTLTNQQGTNVYLKDMVVVAPSAQMATMPAGRIIQWGKAACAGYTPERLAAADVGSQVLPSPVSVSSIATDVTLLVTWVKATGNVNAPFATGTFSIDLSGYDLTANYFHAKYISNGQTKWWIYKRGTNTINSLEQVYVEAPAVNGSYFPFAYFRYGKHSEIGNKTTNAYKTTKALLKELGMDFDTVAGAIDSNPNIGDVEQAMMIMAVPPTSTNAVENEYLFSYFETMFIDMDGSQSLQQARIDGILTNGSGFGNWTTDYGTAIIQDKRFKMALSNGGISKRLVAGSIGAINSYASELVTNTVTNYVTDSETGNQVANDTVQHVYCYRHQITEGVYEEIQVLNLAMTYYIYGGYSTVGNDTNNYLLIPLDYTITQNISLKDREQLYARSLHLVFNSRTTYEVKWYQQEWFGTVLIIAAVVLTIMDMGTDGGSWIATALGVTGTTAVVVTVIFNLIVGMYIMPSVFRLFVKAFGTEVATLLAVAMIIYGAYELGTNGVKGAPLAQDMLMLSTGLQRAVLIDNYENLTQEVKSWEAYAKDEQNTLDAANKLLENSHVLSPFVIFGEKPEDYFNRTVHYGNIGTLGITAISSYVEIALTLPKIQDTLGEELNDLSV